MEYVGKAITLAAALGESVVVLYAVSVVWDLLRRRKRISDRFLTERTAIGCAALVVLIVAVDYEDVRDYLPEGEYQIQVALTVPEAAAPYWVPADLTITKSTEYESGTHYGGAVERERVQRYTTRQYYIYQVYLGERSEETALVVDTEVYPETKTEVLLDEGAMSINPGVITPDTLGLSMANRWAARGIAQNAEIAAAVLCGALLLVQYFFLDKSRERRQTG